ncbi:MAG: CocE/NonD family hydrolase, partial [Planctomycetota bacterium]
MRYLLCALCLLPAYVTYGQETIEVPGRLSGWSGNYRLSLANELTGERPWQGKLHLVAIYSGALTGEQVRQNYSARSKAAAPTATEASSTASPRIRRGLQALYTFDAGRGNVIQDRSGVGQPLDLRIEDPSGVQWQAGVLDIRSSTRIASLGPATKIVDAVKRSNAVTIEAWVKPANDRQDGPARIVSLSVDTNVRNFTLGQDGTRYDVRLRTTATDDNGKPSVSTSDVLTAALTHVVYTRDAPGTARIYINGEQKQTPGEGRPTIPGVQITRDFMLPMSDGIRLRTNIFRPIGSQRLPTILMRTPYGSGGSGLAEYWCPRGYNFVLQTCRGMFGSEGAFYMWHPEIQDGHDTLEWIGKQPWCDGNIGMIGASHVGVTQWHAAFKGSQYLKAIVPVVCPSDFFNDCQYRGGAFRLHLNLSLGISMWYRRRWDAASNASLSVGRYMLPGLYNALPLIEADRAANYTWDFYRDWIRHPARDEYWDTISNLNKFDQIVAPALIVGGYYDA